MLANFLEALSYRDFFNLLPVLAVLLVAGVLIWVLASRPNRD